MGLLLPIIDRGNLKMMCIANEKMTVAGVTKLSTFKVLFLWKEKDIYCSQAVQASDLNVTCDWCPLATRCNCSAVLSVT